MRAMKSSSVSRSFIEVLRVIWHIGGVKISHPFVTQARWRAGVILLLGCSSNSGFAVEPVVAPPLGTIEQVREITPEQADKHFPVHLRGVVTFCDWNADRGLFLQDQTAGIYIGLGTN